MRTTAGVIVGILIGWSALAIWKGPARWLGYRIPPTTPPDHHTRTRVWSAGVEQDGASWPE